MMTSRVFDFTSHETQAARLDKFLSARISDYSRSRLQTMIRDGRVNVNGKVEQKSGAMVELGDVVSIEIPLEPTVSLVPESIPLDIIFENQDLLIINKPAGLVVHPAVGHASGTLVHAVLAHAPDMEGVGGELRPGIVHRLDKDTSGLIIVAKNDFAHRWLQEQFRTRTVKKVYLALVEGHPPTPQGRIDAPIARDPSHRKRMAIVPPGKGRESQTDYYTREQFDQYALIEAHPLTGRTHQIRLHLEFIGCPIVGDSIYGRRKQNLTINRMFLHAWKLTLQLPGDPEERTFYAPLPEELMEVLNSLKSGN